MSSKILGLEFQKGPKVLQNGKVLQNDKSLE